MNELVGFVRPPGRPESRLEPIGAGLSCDALASGEDAGPDEAAIPLVARLWFAEAQDNAAAASRSLRVRAATGPELRVRGDFEPGR